MLDLVLESIQLNLRGYNKIYVFYEASNKSFLDGYEITKKKYIKIFSNNIHFIKKKSLVHTTELFNQYLFNDLLILTDDCLIFRNYDLLNDLSSKFFFNEDKVISNSLRYSIDLPDQLNSNERFTNKIKNDHTNLNNQVFNFAKPNFINFNFSNHIDKEEKNIIPDYGVWSIYDSLNSSIFSSFLNPSLQIFKKQDFLRWINRYGKEKSFLNITDALKYEFYPNVIKNKLIYFLLDNLDKIYHFVCEKISKKKIKPSHIFKNFFSFYFSRTREIDNKYLMCCPNKQIGFDYNIGSIHLNENVSNFKELNDKYLNGFVINYEKFQTLKNNYPFPKVTIEKNFFMQKLLIKHEKK
jgi:hypothetical protein